METATFNPEKNYSEVHAHQEYKYKQDGFYFSGTFECLGHDESIISKREINRQRNTEEKIRRAEQTGLLGDLGGVNNVVIGSQAEPNAEEVRENAQAKAAEDTHG